MVQQKEIAYIELIGKAFQRYLRTDEVLQIEKWVDQEIPLCEIIRAFEIMRGKVQSPSFPYMAAIVNNWENGQGESLYQRSIRIDKQYRKA